MVGSNQGREIRQAERERERERGREGEKTNRASGRRQTGRERRREIGDGEIEPESYLGDGKRTLHKTGRYRRQREGLRNRTQRKKWKGEINRVKKRR